MRPAAHHTPHFDGRRPSIKGAALMSAGGAAIETGLFWADKREPELQVTYER